MGPVRNKSQIRLTRANENGLNTKPNLKRPTLRKQPVMTRSRAAFGELTNSVVGTGLAENEPEFLKPGKKSQKKTSKSSIQSDSDSSAESIVPISQEESLKSSQGSQKSLEESIYYSSLETLESKGEDGRTECEPMEVDHSLSMHTLPEGVEDFDLATADDPIQCGNYAWHIFEYYKQRESEVVVNDYLSRQREVTASMRAILVDWLVELQETFEVSHESLYMAVRIVDLYLMKAQTTKARLQLVGATALFIACKMEERYAPLLSDFLYVCDNAYTRREMILMEQEVLRTIDFQLTFPISYTFLRRYSRVIYMQLPDLTLARWILETSLQEYSLVGLRQSKLAAAALFIALRMKNISTWTPTLKYYSGYDLEELKDEILKLNQMLHQPPKPHLNTIRRKYSHPIFFEAATTPLLEDSQLFS